jgi:hypothetical protein
VSWLVKHNITDSDEKQIKYLKIALTIKASHSRSHQRKNINFNEIKTGKCSSPTIYVAKLLYYKNKTKKWLTFYHSELNGCWGGPR